LVVMELLTDLQVVDCSSGIAGGYCAKLLGGAGADVIKVESPGGDPLRRWTNQHYWSGTPDGTDGALFQFLHFGHRSIVATDAIGGDGGEIAELLAGADILITSPHADAPGLDGLGVDPTALHERFPQLVVVSITPDGLTGPSADRPATEITLQAESGALSTRGRPDRPPVQMGGRTMEWVSGLYAAVAALAAHRVVRRGGPGELVDLSIAEVANTTGTTAADLMDSLRGRPNPGAPARSFETPSIEPTSDGYVGFNTNTRTQFDSFLLMIGRADLIDDGYWASIAHRVVNWDEWNAIIHDFTPKHTTAEVVARAAELRIPVAPVNDGPAVVEFEQAQARGSIVDDPTGTFRVPRRSWRIDGESSPPPQPAPRLGEHTGTIVPRPPKAAATSARTLPLHGVKVLDLTAWWAGPSASAMLAALGADVIHVESVTRPDGMRFTSGVSPKTANWWDYSALFHVSNTNKRDLTLDLTRAEGRALALRLIEQCDMVVENYTPRVIEQFDLGWDVVHATNPRAVMVRMPAFGLDGPWRDRPGFAQTMEQVTGLAWLTGHVDDQPRIQRGPCDPNGGMHAVVGALVALEVRDRAGVGHLVESTMFEAALNISAELIVEWTAYGNALSREGSRSPWAAPQGIYATDTPERWLVLSVVTDEQWAALVDALGRPEWATDPALATHAGRRAAHDLLDAKLATWAADMDLEKALDLLLGAGVPAAPVYDGRRSSHHPQFVARGYHEVLDHPVIGEQAHPSLPFRYASVDRWLRTSSPMLGQHNHEILTDLGLSSDEIAELEANDLIGTTPLGL
jgi:crotonobetainyl-CoA:carnitine CoA-transferase CaiB-like acyl-CoA transferase